jgi:hypothetical protein
MKRTAQKGNHLVICDVCGCQRFRSECKYTWDNMLACVTFNCWYPKDPLFMIPPVINDPRTIYDIRPDRDTTHTTFIEDVGSSTWNAIYPSPAVNGTVNWNAAGALTWDGIDDTHSYIDPIIL